MAIAVAGLAFAWAAHRHYCPDPGIAGANLTVLRTVAFSIRTALLVRVAAAIQTAAMAIAGLMAVVRVTIVYAIAGTIVGTSLTVIPFTNIATVPRRRIPAARLMEVVVFWQALRTVRV
jgi:hypothetical protein